MQQPRSSEVVTPPSDLLPDEIPRLNWSKTRTEPPSYEEYRQEDYDPPDNPIEKADPETRTSTEPITLSPPSSPASLPGYHDEVTTTSTIKYPNYSTGQDSLLQPVQQPSRDVTLKIAIPVVVLVLVTVAMFLLWFFKLRKKSYKEDDDHHHQRPRSNLIQRLRQLGHSLLARCGIAASGTRRKSSQDGPGQQQQPQQQPLLMTNGSQSPAGPVCVTKIIPAGGEKKSNSGQVSNGGSAYGLPDPSQQQIMMMMNGHCNYDSGPPPHQQQQLQPQISYAMTGPGNPHQQPRQMMSQNLPAGGPAGNLYMSSGRSNPYRNMPPPIMSPGGGRGGGTAYSHQMNGYQNPQAKRFGNLGAP